jgi:hypothetical protein
MPHYSDNNSPARRRLRRIRVWGFVTFAAGGALAVAVGDGPASPVRYIGAILVIAGFCVALGTILLGFWFNGVMVRREVRAHRNWTEQRPPT